MTAAAPIEAAGRNQLQNRFLDGAGWGDAARHPLPKDASYRRYVRLRRGSESAILMDAPPGLEDVRPFLDIGRQLHGFGYSAPRVLAENIDDGFLLLEDLGDRTFTRELAGGADEADLYSLATDVLADLHDRAPAAGYTAPAFDSGRLVEEVDRMLRWYAPLVLGDLVDDDAAEAYRAIWQRAVPILTPGGRTLVLRDFHVDNLMIVEGRAGIARCGLLDFQDALDGPTAYDLVSLLQDSRRDLAPGLEAAMLDRYRAARAPADWDAFLRAYHALGAHRAIKVLGMFGRQLGFFGNTGYLVHIPRIWAHIERDLALAGLDEVQAWLDRHLPADRRVVPPPDARLPSSVSPAIKR